MSHSNGQYAMIPRVMSSCRGHKGPSFKIGDRVAHKQGRHGVIVSKRGSCFYVRWDDGSESSAGFGNFNIYHERAQ